MHVLSPVTFESVSFTGGWHSVEIRASGPVISIFVDGKTALECIDDVDPIQTGDALSFNADGSEPADLYFDDIEIWGDQDAAVIFHVTPTPRPCAAPTLQPAINVTSRQNESQPGIPSIYLLGAAIVLLLMITGGFIMVRNSRNKARANNTVQADGLEMVDKKYEASKTKATIPYPADIDVFISYSSKDKNVADAICHGLETHKLKCWIAPRDVLVGQPFEESIMNAIEHCKVMVMVFTENTNHSPHVENEIRTAWNAGIPIIPSGCRTCRSTV